MKKKMIVLFIALSMLFITACGNGQESTDSVSVTQSDDVQEEPSTAISQSRFFDAMNKAGFLDNSTFEKEFSTSDKKMLNKMKASNVVGLYSESRPFNISEVKGLDQYRYLNISAPDGNSEGNPILSRGFICYFSFKDDDSSRFFVDDFVGKIKINFPDVPLEHSISDLMKDEDYYYALEELSTAAIDHCIYRYKNVVIYIECISDINADSVISQLRG